MPGLSGNRRSSRRPRNPGVLIRTSTISALTKTWPKLQRHGCDILDLDHTADCDFRVRRLATAAARLPANEPKATVNDTQ